MSESCQETLAPCVAVVGPANSGKTTLLHCLDDALQRHSSQPLAYVVKGNPDGTGRYLFHAPGLREAIKEQVKGAWCDTTVETVCRWIEHCRRQLDLVLVDLGGRHAPTNEVIFEQCTHYIAVARTFPDPAQERQEGMASWIEACERGGLRAVARLRSFKDEGTPHLERSGGEITGAFRADASSPDDLLNKEVIRGVTEALLALRREHRSPTYLDLRLPRDWRPEDLVDLGGLAGRVLDRVKTKQPLVLGGRAPIWAYAAVLHRVLDVEPQAVVEVFDPKVPSGLVEVPVELADEADADLSAGLRVGWRRRSGAGGGTLTLSIVTPDRFLGLPRPERLAAVPRPEGDPPPGPLVVSGAAPIWLHLTYARWLRSFAAGQALGVWDARQTSAVFVTGPGSPCLEPWDEPADGAGAQAPPVAGVSLFVRCGERYVPPSSGGPWRVIDLPHDLRPEDLPPAVQRVRESLRGHRAARLLVAGPVGLGIAFGQGLAHEPVAIDYLQLNQTTKEFEVWLTNRRNL